MRVKCVVALKDGRYIGFIMHALLKQTVMKKEVVVGIDHRIINKLDNGRMQLNDTSAL